MSTLIGKTRYFDEFHRRSITTTVVISGSLQSVLAIFKRGSGAVAIGDTHRLQAHLNENNATVVSSQQMAKQYDRTKFPLIRRQGMSLIAPVNAWEPPLLIYSILKQPTKTLIRFLDLLFALLRSKPREKRSPVRVVCISDTHCLKWDDIPDGDLLIHAGDLTNHGTPAEIQAQINWLSRLPHRHKVVIAGNHDTFLDPRSRQTLAVNDQQGGLNWGNIHYLQHSSVVLKFNAGRQLKVHGAPQVPTVGNPDWAFRYSPDSDAWSQTIPRDTDVLVTHIPPKYHLDLPSALGCPHLLAESWRIKPKLHVFGHVHAARTFWLGWLLGGKQLVRWDALQRTVERALTRPDGLLKGLLNPQAWFDVLRVLYFGTATLLWDRIWGGQGRSTLMVNAALMYNSSGKLGNRPQVVDL